MFLLRLGVGFAAWIGALLALAPAINIPFGQESGAGIGGGVGLLLFFGVVGMAIASATVRIAFGRGLMVIGACFWVAIFIGAIFRYPEPLAMADPVHLQYVTVPVLAIGGLIGGLLLTVGHLVKRNPEATAPGFLARKLGPMMEGLGGGMFNARRVHAHRRLPQGAEQSVSRFDESLPHLKGFNAYYRDNMKGWLDGQEQRRKEALRYRLKVLVIGLPLMAVITLVLNELIPFSEGFWGTVVGWIDLFAWLFVFGLAFGKGFELSDDVKEFMIGHLCRFFQLTHDAEKKGANLEAYVALDLIPSHSHAEVKESFQGRLEDVAMFMVEATAYSYVGGATRRRRVVEFSGALLEFAYRKRFQGHTIALSDRGLIGNLFIGRWNKNQRIRLENAEFEDRFEVFGTDPVESRYLLTPLFMERMVALSDLIGKSKKLRFAFAKDRLLVVVPGWDLFETASLAHAMTDPVHVQTFLNEVGLVMDIAHTMKLSLDSRV